MKVAWFRLKKFWYWQTAFKSTWLIFVARWTVHGTVPFAYRAVPAVGRVKQVFLAWEYLIHSLDSDPVVGRLVLKYRGAKVSASGRCGSVKVTDVQVLKPGLGLAWLKELLLLL